MRQAHASWKTAEIRRRGRPPQPRFIPAQRRGDHRSLAGQPMACGEGGRSTGGTYSINEDPAQGQAEATARFCRDQRTTSDHAKKWWAS